MEVINGQWYMNGRDIDDPGCVRDSAGLLKVIEEVGFLPLFESGIPGFSVENLTATECWWCGDEATDPWEWRITLTRTGKVAYGKFFNKKAGFVSREWFPHFANMRRDGYDFDARYEDGKASMREKLIMDQFWPDERELCDITDPETQARNRSLLSNDLKEKAGFGKGGDKGFETACSKLQMQTYLIAEDFQQRQGKRGEPYGWPIAVYTLPEYRWGYDFTTSEYKTNPKDSRSKITHHIATRLNTDEEAVWKVMRG